MKNIYGILLLSSLFFAGCGKSDDKSMEKVEHADISVPCQVILQVPKSGKLDNKMKAKLANMVKQNQISEDSTIKLSCYGAVSENPFPTFTKSIKTYLKAIGAPHQISIERKKSENTALKGRCVVVEIVKKS